MHTIRIITKAAARGVSAVETASVDAQRVRRGRGGRVEGSRGIN